MRKLIIFVSLAIAIAGCGGGVQQATVPGTTDAQKAPAMQAPAMPQSLRNAPALPAFAKPQIPAALSAMKTPELTPQRAQALSAQRSTKAPEGRATGFFANEVALGPDANGYIVYYLPALGYYTYVSTVAGQRPIPGWLYKYGFGWLYDLGSSSPGSSDVYFYDQELGFIYTATGFGSDAANYLYFYHFGSGHFMVYFQSFSFPRFFYDYNTGRFFSKSVFGDMLALASSHGWNYQSPLGGGITLSTYVDPTPFSDGSVVFVGSAVLGYVTTVLTDHNTAETNAVGGLNLVLRGDGYHLLAEVSAGSLASFPGAPLFIGNSLIEGAVSSPYPGVTETVLNVGPQPGESACGTTRDGAKVRYDVAGNGSWTLSVVPYCGITQFVAASGATFTLQSTGIYAIGDLSKARRVQSANLVTTIMSILGRGKQEFPAASLIKL
ncbi:MAG: hypothetical protein JWM87_4275 [Candidatus Eremiobacteraeota bacterium]|nr:hypothetical protein [Candidatus Eremiobacteraeota bacterium]